MDIVERTEALLEQDGKNWLWPIVRDLIAEVKSLRWQVKHGGDHMCDECWPVDER